MDKRPPMYPKRIIDGMRNRIGVFPYLEACRVGFWLLWLLVFWLAYTGCQQREESSSKQALKIGRAHV